MTAETTAPVAADTHIRTEITDGVMVITMDRADKKNALTHAMYDALADAFADAHCNADVRVLLLQAAGDLFTAGNDLNDFMAAPPNFDSHDTPPVGRFLQALNSTTKPLMMAVNGKAIGIGTTMVLHADLAYAGDDAVFKMPFIDLALVPEAGSSLLLPQLVGPAKAAEWLLLGEAFDAAEAKSAGLVAEVYPAAELQARVLEKARKLASRAPRAVRDTKALLKPHRADVAARIAEEGRLFSAALSSPEFREAVTAFFEKRPADFSKAV